MHQDYYTLGNKQCVEYIYKYRLEYAYGNTFKYITRAGRKPDNSSESDFNKALTFVTSINDEMSVFYRYVKHIKNSIMFTELNQLKEHPLSEVLKSLIVFDSPNRIASMIVHYMKEHNITIKEEFKCYE